MKVTFDIDCTPEEARRFMGLPDLSPVNEAYVAKLSEIMEGGAAPEVLMKSLGSAGDAGMAFWRNLFAGGNPGQPKV